MSRLRLDRVARMARDVVPFPVRKYLRSLQKQWRSGRFARGPHDIVYVLTVAGLCGGVRVVLEHVSRLRDRGHRVAIYGMGGDLSWFPREVPACLFKSVDGLRQALAEFRGIKVATWHETAPLVAESLRPGDRGYYLVQDIEESYGETAEQSEQARATYGLGLQPIAEGLWVERRLREQFGLDPIQVHIGLDLETFRPRGGKRRPQQIMTQARTWSGGVGAGHRIKGWDIAQEVIRRTRTLNAATELLTFSLEEAPKFPPGLICTHHQYPGDDQLAGLYSAAGLYLLTSRHEGFGLTAAEAMACGCPVVATRADGNEEFCLDGRTALTAEPQDVERLARHCVRVQSEPDLAADLAAAGRSFIQQYTWDRVIDRLEAEFTRRPPPIELPAKALPPGQFAIPFSELEYPDLALDAEPDCDWTVVIPTVGAAGQVVECISSCRRHAAPRGRIQFVVVDDGCPDPAEVDVLEEAAGEVGFELRRHYQNLGFSAAVNSGLRGARGRFALLCNNDVVFDRPWEEAAERAFASDPRVGIVGARLLTADGQTIEHGGTDKVPGQLTYPHAHEDAPAEYGPARRDRYVWYATGALAAFRRSTLRRLGGLSTGYGLAYEDLDYCLRAWLLGVRVLYCGEFAARHGRGGTRGATTVQKRERPLLWRQREEAGRAYFLRKWGSLQHVEDLSLFLEGSDAVVGGMSCSSSP